MAGSVELRWGGASTGRVRSEQPGPLPRPRGHRPLGGRRRHGRPPGRRDRVGRGVRGHRPALRQPRGRRAGRGVEAANAAVYRRGSGDPTWPAWARRSVAIALVDDSRGDRCSPSPTSATPLPARRPRARAADRRPQPGRRPGVEGSLSPEEAAVHWPQHPHACSASTTTPTVDHVTVMPHNGDRHAVLDGLFNECPDRPSLLGAAPPGRPGRRRARAGAPGQRGWRPRQRDGRGGRRGRRRRPGAAPPPPHWGLRLGGTGGSAPPARSSTTRPTSTRSRRGRRRNRKSGPRHVAKAAKKQKPRRFLARVPVRAAAAGAGRRCGGHVDGTASPPTSWASRATGSPSSRGDPAACSDRARAGRDLRARRDRVPEDQVDELRAGVEQSSKSDTEAYVNRVSERAEQLSPRRRPPPGRRPPPPRPNDNNDDDRGHAAPDATGMIGAARRNTELGLLILSGLFVGAYVLASLPEDGQIPANIGPFLIIILGLQLIAHIAMRRLAPRPTACCCRSPPCWRASATCSSSASTRPAPNPRAWRACSRCG